MDLYLTSTEPGMTLQEMIECDIKSELKNGILQEDLFTFDTLMNSHELNTLDLSGISGLEGELDFKAFEPLFDPLDKLDDMDVGSSKDEDEEEDDKAFPNDAEEVHDTVSSWMNFSSMSNYMDIEDSVMVNPSLVIPSTLPSRAQQQQTLAAVATPSPPLSSSPVTSSSCVLVKEEKSREGMTQLFRSRQVNQGTTQVLLCPADTSTSSSVPAATRTITSLNNTKLVNTVVNQTNSQMSLGPNKAHSNPIHHSNSSTQANHLSSSTIASTTTVTGLNGKSVHHVLSRTASFPSNKGSIGSSAANRSKYTKFKRDKLPEERTFPKPAYSYSCLIALALKNSSNGSLPVSEIYNFMCEHFPYFRTAPNGWKNSVRHNLSLNKCFEKIEKPVVSGGNQRKGCLWALNPAKAHKMDDEVQKWSKKGLQEIKDAMTYPEVLESLERGEMKFETSSGASSCSEDDDDYEEIDPIASPEHCSPSLKVTNAFTTTPLKQSRVIQGLKGTYIQQNAKHTTNFTTHQITRTNPQIQIRKPLTAVAITAQSQEDENAEYILPHTLPEINIQSNGSLIDDFGNEITIEGDMGILNPPSNGSTRSFILSQTTGSGSPSSATVVRSSAGLRTNFVYSSPAVSSPHQTTVGRLVVTNAKPS